MTNETFCENRHIYLGFSIFGHILFDFMEIFQDGAFTNLEYHLVQNMVMLHIKLKRITNAATWFDWSTTL